MKGPGFLKKLSLRNLNNIQINEPIDKNSEESNDLIHITTPSNISKIKYRKIININHLYNKIISKIFFIIIDLIELIKLICMCWNYEIY